MCGLCGTLGSAVDWSGPTFEQFGYVEASSLL
jgi:hypothetical protein